jgi:hypothetical protein
MIAGANSILRWLALASLVALAGCAGGAADLSQPLAGPLVRQRLVGRTFTGLVGNQRFFITFARNGTATYYGTVTQYVHWRVGDAGLCIAWDDASGEKCGPVYMLGYAAYRVGSVTMKEIAVPHRF